MIRPDTLKLARNLYETLKSAEKVVTHSLSVYGIRNSGQFL
jgi:hypothetical protein